MRKIVTELRMSKLDVREVTEMFYMAKILQKLKQIAVYVY